ncbi:hypothetical protein KEM55_006472, partial [Ascosphaera atra]
MPAETSPAPQGPEARVLIIMTGGTICMRNSPSGLVPAQGFLESALEPMTIFNDASNPADVDVAVSESGERQRHR